ncbi:class I mannose-6-phosphate isomerase [Tessaracoccus antarcticus]|uniref:Phosphohexomutase n=1 Tax=Tessaracoccus antarcticus TaxID=2479848 RepID=A0A3M0G4C3_9ACTN|nr:class I mannose-6-phosphate isomerase [Tessaracoccus antarcticus]RMB59851.1 carbohydrate kinase [Tessaracoccus antarcticus]
MQPLLLPANQPADRFYRGGPAIRAFRRGQGAAGDFVPEDWVGSTTTLFGEDRLGLTTLPDGKVLRDAILEEPGRWLGQNHLDSFGVDPKILVKLLDAGERLPVHAHPDVSFAAEHLGAAHGKAEAWFALAPGTVHVGLKRDISRQELLDLMSSQNTTELLGLLHERRLEPGDTLFVPPGTLHAIGEGNFVVEVQEPEDMSILAEWKTFAIDGAKDGHLGLGFNRAVDAIDRRGYSDAEVDSLITRQRTGPSILSPLADDYFCVARCDVDGEALMLPAMFQVLIMVSGEVELASQGGDIAMRKGDTVLVGHGCGDVRLTGSGSVVAVLPPLRAAAPS